MKNLSSTQRHDGSLSLKRWKRIFILVRKLRALVSSSAFVGDAEVRDEFDRRNTKVKFEYAVITQADILKELHPTDEELKAYYERNKATYNNSIPEKRQIKYVVFDSAKITAATTVTTRTCSLLRSARRRVPRARAGEGRHILIKTPLPAAGAKEDEKACRRCARESGRRLEAGQSRRRFCQARGKVFRRSGQRQERRRTRLDRPRPHRA
jgi:peptidyl-prolyl cis-trans isomerase D